MDFHIKLEDSLEQIIAQSKEKGLYSHQEEHLDPERRKSNFEKNLDYEMEQITLLSEDDWVSFSPFDPSLKNWRNGDLILTLDTRNGTITSSNHNVYSFSSGEWLFLLKSPENDIEKWVPLKTLLSQVQRDIAILSKLSPNDLIPSRDYAFKISENNREYEYATNLKSSPPLSYQFEDGHWNFHPQHQEFLPELAKP